MIEQGNVVLPAASPELSLKEQFLEGTKPPVQVVLTQEQIHSAMDEAESSRSRFLKNLLLLLFSQEERRFKTIGGGSSQWSSASNSDVCARPALVTGKLDPRRVKYAEALVYQYMQLTLGEQSREKAVRKSVRNACDTNWRKKFGRNPAHVPATRARKREAPSSLPL